MQESQWLADAEIRVSDRCPVPAFMVEALHGPNL